MFYLFLLVASGLASLGLIFLATMTAERDPVIKVGGGMATLVFVGVFLYGSVWVIPEGKVGATRFLGQYSETVYQGGQLHLTNPLASRFQEDARTRNLNLTGKRRMDLTLGNGSKFSLEASVVYTFSDEYFVELLSKSQSDFDVLVKQALYSAFRSVVKDYPTFADFSERRRSEGAYEGRVSLGQEIQQITQDKLDRIFLTSMCIDAVSERPVVRVGEVNIRDVDPSAQIQAAAAELEAETVGLRTAEVEQKRARIDAERAGEIIPVLERIMAIIPEGETAKGFAEAVTAAAQLRETEAKAKALKALAEAMTKEDSRVKPIFMVGGGGSGPLPTLPVTGAK